MKWYEIKERQNESRMVDKGDWKNKTFCVNASRNNFKIAGDKMK